MGWGDELIGSGLARGARDRGKLIAFGANGQLRWSAQASEIFKDNPNVARPGEEHQENVEWIAHYQGCRVYGKFDGLRWVFNDHECKPGEVFFTKQERSFAEDISPSRFVILEPTVKRSGACVGANKQWPVARYQAVADQLSLAGIMCVQFVQPVAYGALLEGVWKIHTETFRQALAVMERASLYIGPEGGLHHGAAATGTDAVVIWGGFNTPKSTGYRWHRNITVGEPCGRFAKCPHCAEAMKSISVDLVFNEAMQSLGIKV